MDEPNIWLIWLMQSVRKPALNWIILVIYVKKGFKSCKSIRACENPDIEMLTQSKYRQEQPWWWPRWPQWSSSTITTQCSSSEHAFCTSWCIGLVGNHTVGAYKQRFSPLSTKDVIKKCVLTPFVSILLQMHINQPSNSNNLWIT